jgi:hypothetical protein
MFGAMFAKQGLRQHLRQMQLAYPGAAMEEQRVRQSVVHADDPIPNVLLPRKIVY